jgi:hypothetical protein
MHIQCYSLLCTNGGHHDWYAKCSVPAYPPCYSRMRGHGSCVCRGMWFVCARAFAAHAQGYCSLGVLCQNLENPHLRSALGMAPTMTGILMNTIQKTSNAAAASGRGNSVCGGRGRGAGRVTVGVLVQGRLGNPLRT